MKLFALVFAFALLYKTNGLPINNANEGATAPVDQKPEAKSEVQSTPLAAEKLTESATKESSSPAPSSTQSNEERSSSPKEELLPLPSKPAVPSPIIPVEEHSSKVPTVNNVPPSDAPKSETGTKSASLTSEQAEKSDKVEQVSASSEKPKELNNQVNAVSVDEPKPVQNEVKSEIPKEETIKSESVKEDVKSEKIVEKKDEKLAAPILSGVEAKPTEKLATTEEIKKPVASSEEKTGSQERDNSKETEKKEPVRADHSAESSEEKKIERPLEGGKKEESSVKPQAEPLPTESTKPSTIVASPLSAEKSSVKPESEKDVIKREAAGKDKHDEKKSTDNFAKKDKIKNSQPVKEVASNEEVKNTKSQ